jgi:hypothetical protein
MTALLMTTRAVAIATVAALAALTLVGLLTGAIRTRGLISVRITRNRTEVSPLRVQLLLVTVASAAHYLQLVFQAQDLTRLPDPPTAWLTALGASNGAYIVGRTGTWLMDLVRHLRRP